MRFLFSAKKFILKRHWLLVNLFCFIAFSIQFANVLEGYIMPSQTNTDVEEKELRDLGFPVVLKICFKPGFNESAIVEAGYSGIWGLFSGQNMKNR